MIKKSCYALLTIIVLCSNSAHAVSANVLSASALYGGIQSPSSYNNSSRGAYSDLGGFGYRIGFIHYFDNYQYKLNHKWRLGIKAAYTKPADNNYGDDYKTNRYKIAGETMSVLVVAKYYFNSNYFLMFGGGAARVVQTLYNSGTARDTNKELSPEYDAGVGVKLSQKADISAQYTYIDGEKPDFSNSSLSLKVNAPISMYGVMFSYRLGR